MPIALPIPRALFTRLGFPWVTHITRQVHLGGPGRPGIVQQVVSRSRHDWSRCEVALTATSGFGDGGRRLLRDYSVLDFELGLQDRGSYCYFFAGSPGTWGLVKNFHITSEDDLLDQGYATIRIATDALLARYDGLLFFRPDDMALMIRGGYTGPALVKGLPIN